MRKTTNCREMTRNCAIGSPNFKILSTNIENIQRLSSEEKLCQKEIKVAQSEAIHKNYVLGAGNNYEEMYNLCF